MVLERRELFAIASLSWVSFGRAKALRPPFFPLHRFHKLYCFAKHYTQCTIIFGFKHAVVSSTILCYSAASSQEPKTVLSSIDACGSTRHAM